jgi:hypothetical protein
MGRRTTFTGYIRARGATNASSSRLDGPPVGVVPIVIRILGLDATEDAGFATGVFLPIGAIVLSVATIDQASSGGTNPILDVGLGADPDGLANGMTYDADDSATPGNLGGVLMGRATATVLEITYGDDGVGTNNTGGAIDLYITYTFDDDGSLAN